VRTAYYRRESKDKHGNVNSKWVCSGKINNGADSYPSFPIYELEIKPILFDVFSETWVDVETLLAEYTEMCKYIETDDKLAKRIAEQKQMIEFAWQKKNKLLELVTVGAVTAFNFKSMTDSCDREIEEAGEAIVALEKQMFTKEEYKRHIAEEKTRLDAAVKDASSGLVTPEFVSQYIDKITVTDDDTANLNIKIFTGKNTEKWLKKLAEYHHSHTDHTLKII